MKAIVFLFDSLNRGFLPLYGNDWVQAPNVAKLAGRSVIFDNHWVGSAPCMPARRDMFTGRLNFLERNWGPIEPFDYTLPHALQEHGIFAHMITDHYHYLRTGGENYCQQFDTWECIRGQENDPWVSRVNKGISPPHYGKYSPQYGLNRTEFLQEANFPGPMTLQAAADWLEDNADADNYLLWVEVFDPHEPFDVTSEYLDLYHDDYSDLLYEWPEYKKVNVPPQALEHIRKRYAALISMSDRWLGKVLDVIDKHQLWDDTLITFTTDHGFMLGEHEFMGKNYMPAYNEVFHIPLMIHLPQDKYSGSRINALTQNIDLFPTLMDYFGIGSNGCQNKLHGESLLPLLSGTNKKIRDYAIYGYFGRDVNITDGHYTYFRTPTCEANDPLYIYTAMPTTINQFYYSDCMTDLLEIEMGRFLPWTNYPVYKIPKNLLKLNAPTLRFNQRGQFLGQNLLFDIINDYAQENPLVDLEIETQLCKMLVETMRKHNTPEEQLERLGLSDLIHTK